MMDRVMAQSVPDMTGLPHGYLSSRARSARRDDSKTYSRLRMVSACSGLAPPRVRSASMAERAACSDASVSEILAWSPGSGTSSRSAYSVCARSSARRWMSAHLAPASAAAIAPGDSATLIASCRAEPFAYASISLDCQSAAAADRCRAERAISAITVASTRTPSRIHSQRRLPLPDPAAGEVAALGDSVVGGGVGVAVEVTVDVMVVVGVMVGVGVGVGVTVVVDVSVGALVVVGVTVDVAVRLGRLLIALCTELEHPAARHPVMRMATGRARAFAEHLMSILPRCSWQPLDHTGTVSNHPLAVRPGPHP